jgi:ABC-type glycerol-3-phosphate transport system permease component
MIPVGSLGLIYFRMVRYIKQMSKRVTPANTLSRAERELKMIVRIIRLVLILLSMGLPFTIFMFMSFFNSTPKYSFRIGYIFMDVSLIFIIIALFQNTDPVKTSLKKKINWRPNEIIAIVT